MHRLKAQVTWFNQDKRFGFAVPDIVAVDVLINLNLLNTPELVLEVGDRVYVEFQQKDGAFYATNVIPL
ncbi:hypothetical protein JCM19241_3297 [Vibrio ishigakensis]|uniref:CSD domain-containing protein n=1 Tax=Vibrio ishigakensis TaxID=1481914 RepID=A0A0B8Q6V8_9VIBR|nr:hypothetical protein JCM19241_3297 [Vibrio ishigakensis]